MENIILDKIYVKGNLIEYQISYSKKLSKYFSTNIFWIEYEQDMTGVPESILSIPFVSNFLAFSWLTDAVLWVKDIDQSFYDSVRNLKVAYQELYPHFKLKGRFIPAIITKNTIDKSNGNTALLLFSGGVDAHTSYIRNKDKNLLLCNIQGWFKNINDQCHTTETEINYISSIAKSNLQQLTIVKSNFATILKLNIIDFNYRKKVHNGFWYGFIHSMAFIGHSIPIAYKHQIKEIIIASSYTIGDSLICASYPTTDNEYRFGEKGFCRHDSFELSRQRKIHTIVEHQKKTGTEYPLLVCSFNDHNCCKCEKCFRTILGLIAENANPNNFGFHINDNITEYWDKIIRDNITFMGFNNEKISYWPHIKKRMKENYPYMNKEYQEFVDWFLNFDFDKEKKRAVVKYRIKNFFPILKRKIYNKFL